MSKDLTTAYPQSFNEISETIQHWWDKHHTHRQLPISWDFSSDNSLVMKCRREHYFRVKWDRSSIVCESASHKLNLVLADDWDIATEVDDRLFSCQFKRRVIAHKPLSDMLRAVAGTKHPLFVSRAINAVRELEEELPKEKIEEASAASTDYLVLLKALCTPSVVTTLALKDPLAKAKFKGALRQQELLKASGGVVGTQEVAEVLGISRQAVDKRRRQGQLIGLLLGKRGYAYPAWQFEKGRTLPNLEKVLGLLQGHDPWMQLTFFVNGNARLEGKSPIEVLRAGETESVLRAAESYGEQGLA